MRIKLNGTVIPDEYQWLYDWFGIGAFSPGVVRQAIADNPEGEDLELEINSGGGSVFAGFEIYSLLRGAKCRTVAEVQSLAASAASTIISGCSVVNVSPVAQIMLHQPACGTSGNIDDHGRSLRMLESIMQSIINGYELRCAGKCSRERLTALVNDESWITAQDAVEIGLADHIMYDSDGVLNESAVNAIGGGIRSLVTNAAPGAPDVASLMARYEQLVSQGAAPADGHPVAAAPPPAGSPPADTQPPAPGVDPTSLADSWQAKARLEIEKNRF